MTNSFYCFFDRLLVCLYITVHQYMKGILVRPSPLVIITRSNLCHRSFRENLLHYKLVCELLHSLPEFFNGQSLSLVYQFRGPTSHEHNNVLGLLPVHRCFFPCLLPINPLFSLLIGPRHNTFGQVLCYFKIRLLLLLSNLPTHVLPL